MTLIGAATRGRVVTEQNTETVKARSVWKALCENKAPLLRAQSLSEISSTLTKEGTSCGENQGGRCQGEEQHAVGTEV